jgi:phospholipase D1/2
MCEERKVKVTAAMKPAPYPHDDEIGKEEDLAVADPLADSTLGLWNDTARRNREIFTEIFRPVPTNLARDWNGYDVWSFPTFLEPDPMLTYLIDWNRLMYPK